MHAILSLGAAHLHARTDLELKQTVERHRFLAIEGLNSKEVLISSFSRRKDEAGTRLTALLATAYALTFTASYMGDTMGLFLILVRACASISKEIIREGHASALIPLDARFETSNAHLNVMQRRLRNAATIPGDDVNGAKVSLRLVEEKCNFLPFQLNLLQSMKLIVNNIDTPFQGKILTIQVRFSPTNNLTAYQHFVAIWDLFTEMAPEDFAAFSDNANLTSVVLQAHFLAMEAMLKSWLMVELGERENVQRNGLLALRCTVLSTVDFTSSLFQWPLSILTRGATWFKKGS